MTTNTSYNAEWRKHYVEDEDREILMRFVDTDNVIASAKVISTIAELATQYELQEQVSCSVTNTFVTMTLHFSAKGPIRDVDAELAKAIDTAIEPYLSKI